LKLKNRFLFYLAGVILASDKLGKLNCSLQGCKKETNWFSILFTIPNSVKFQWVVATPDIKTIIEAHANTYRV
jgi:hypothetical protein